MGAQNSMNPRCASKGEVKNSFQEHVELMTDLIVLAFQTDMTRVATQCLGGEAGPNYRRLQGLGQQGGSPATRHP